MQGESSAKTIARWVALGALFLAPITPLIVVNSFFFPFITGKAFYFRILVEIALGAWVVLAVLDRAYRPRFSWIGLLVIVFVAWMFVADLFAVNVLKAFWSNFERMEGWILLIHLLAFFFVASNVLRVEKQWRNWFLWSLGVSIVVVLHSLLQISGALPIHQGSTRIDASFGNSAYLAIYLLFNTFIAGWLALTEKRAWLKWSLFVLGAIEAVLVFVTETRGTVLGLVGALILAAFLTALTSAGKTRRVAAGMLVLIVILSGAVYLARDSSFVQGNGVLQRITSISVADGQTRFEIWGMAYQGFLERPIVGWGQEGFNYVFNQFYNPALYNQEEWFDRAHNAFLDWLVAGGLPAFLLYISLFGSALVLIWKRPEFLRTERIILTAVLAGYACHNLFVFDNLYSYVYFFAILAFIDARIAQPFTKLEKAKELKASAGLSYAFPAAVVVVGALIWFINVPGIAVASDLITAITPGSDPATNLAMFQNILARNPFAAQEVREQLVSFAVTEAGDSSISTDEKQQIISYAITEMQKQVESYPLDAREHLELAYVYDAAGDMPDTLSEIQTALQLSPDKESIWVQAGITEWDAGNNQAAQQDFTKAYNLGPEFPDLAAYAAAGDYAVGDMATGDQLLLGAYGTTTVDNDALATVYYETKDWSRLISLWQLRASEPNASVQTQFGLAAAYYAAGEKAQSIAEIKSIMAQNPDAAAAGEAAISQIESGTPLQ